MFLSREQFGKLKRTRERERGEGREGGREGRAKMHNANARK